MKLVNKLLLVLILIISTNAWAETCSAHLKCPNFSQKIV